MMKINPFRLLQDLIFVTVISIGAVLLGIHSGYRITPVREGLWRPNDESDVMPASGSNATKHRPEP